MLPQEALAIAAAQLIIVRRKFAAEKPTKGTQNTAGERLVSIRFFVLAIAPDRDLA